MIIVMRKLWNRPALPVWSLVTRDASGQANMNICTYVMAVSLEPKLMSVAVYRGTKTLANLEENPQQTVLLQLLSESLAPVVRVCGQQSGNSIDKIARLKKRYALSYYEQLPYLSDIAGYMVLTQPTVTEVPGDHVLYTYSVATHKNLTDYPLLTTDYLRAKKIIR